MDRKTLFFTLLKNFFEKEGFVFVKSKNSFVKKEDGNEFHFGFDLSENFSMVEAKLQILIGEVETVKKNAWGKMYDKFVSVGRVKSYLIDNPKDGHSWTDTEENVRLAAEKEIYFYNTFAKMYFKKYIDLKYLDEVLNKKHGEELYLAHNPIHTSFLAIIVAFLVKNSQLENLYSFYRGIILKFNDAFIEEYDSLVKYLKMKGNESEN